MRKCVREPQACEELSGDVRRVFLTGLGGLVHSLALNWLLANVAATVLIPMAVCIPALLASGFLHLLLARSMDFHIDFSDMFDAGFFITLALAGSVYIVLYTVPYMKLFVGVCLALKRLGWVRLERLDDDNVAATALTELTCIAALWVGGVYLVCLMMVPDFEVILRPM